ncbi:MAG: CBS domain-containing protein [Solirubrobacteraceae bacterium]
MSPRAACRLATIGFESVYDYMPGKVDWMARGLPLEGEKAGEPRAIDYVCTDMITCGLQDTVGEVRARVAQSPPGFAFVLGPGGVLLGRLRKAVLRGSDDTMAQDVMEPGPSTTRPDTPPDKLLAKLQAAELTSAVLSDPEGRLLGVVRRADLERCASESPR